VQQYRNVPGISAGRGGNVGAAGTTDRRHPAGTKPSSRQPIEIHRKKAAPKSGLSLIGRKRPRKDETQFAWTPNCVALQYIVADPTNQVKKAEK